MNFIDKSIEKSQNLNKIAIFHITKMYGIIKGVIIVESNPDNR
ncbi:MAG: hypothetical protein ACFFD2_04065 [Promethearchaeota archaeon]